ncbi:hypothetical protein H6G27_02610 [Nostoc linckia FACHB-104]|nr:hypothetical protein [Nostoc linckia FACHB-104]
MLTKILWGLLGVSLSLASDPVNARTIWLPGATNEGARLSIETTPQPTYNSTTGLTHFTYGIQDSQGYRTNNASTWWCYKGLLRRNPKFQVEGFNKVPIGWLVDSLEDAGETPIVTADSEASINLLRAICKVVE